MRCARSALALTLVENAKSKIQNTDPVPRLICMAVGSGKIAKSKIQNTAPAPRLVCTAVESGKIAKSKIQNTDPAPAARLYGGRNR